MEKYLNKCLDSVVNQTYSHLEIVIINDGSNDNSLTIINSYADNDSRIHVIDKENEGIGGAYQDALKIVSGDYISFVDADDYIELDMYEILASNINKGGADIIQFGYKRYNELDDSVTRGAYGEGYIMGNLNIEYYRYKKINHPGLASKIVKKHLFDDIIILKQNVGIDVLINIQLYLKAESMLLIENELYNAIKRQESVSRMSYNETKANQLASLRTLIFKILMSTRDKDFISHYLPTLLNETIILADFYYKNNQIEKYNNLITEYKLYYTLLYDVLKLCRFVIITKATIFKLFPKGYLRFIY